MRTLIMGCGRVGAELAATLEEEGHDVTVLDIEPYSFRRLPTTFRGRKVIGNGIDTEKLVAAGIEDSEAFVAVTQGDNRNIMAAQIAKHVFNVPHVVCRIYDPLREEIYRAMGIATVSPTKVGARLLREALTEEVG
ncbi:MAG TPA: TrkA family potassium uptake protein [Dehalococcoidia bacterium]|nr:TrkA family potassium uptake protein [Dehalococcoidia bacterium]